LAYRDRGGGQQCQAAPLITIFDPREVIELGFAATKLEQLDEVVGPATGRSFALRIAEHDFSAAGDIPHQPAGIAG